MTCQAISRGFAFLGAGIAPAFERAIGGGGVCRAEAGAVDQQPKHREGRDVLVGEHLRQIGLDIGRTGQRGIVAHEAQLHPVGHDAPEGLVPIIQMILKGECRRARPVRRERRAAAIKQLGRRDDDDRHTVGCDQGDRCRRYREVGVPEGFLEEVGDEA